MVSANFSAIVINLLNFHFPVLLSKSNFYFYEVTLIPLYSAYVHSWILPFCIFALSEQLKPRLINAMEPCWAMEPLAVIEESSLVPTCGCYILYMRLAQSRHLVFVSYLMLINLNFGFPGGSDGKESACNAGDQSSTPGLGRSPGEENGNLLQCSCLENSMDRRAWWATVHGVTKSRTQLSN